jgi:hypothetical protein
LLVMSYSVAGLGISPEGLGVDTRTGSIFIGDCLNNRKIWEVSGIVPACTGVLTRYGSGCRDGGGSTPFLEASDCPSVGGYLGFVEVTSASQGAFGIFFFGANRNNISLAGLGAPGCSALADPRWILSVVPVKDGRAPVDVVLPGDPSIRGARIAVHMINFPDSGTNPGQISAPNAIEVTFQ